MLNLQQTQYEHVLGGVASVPLDSRLGAADPTVNTVPLLNKLQDLKTSGTGINLIRELFNSVGAVFSISIKAVCFYFLPRHSCKEFTHLFSRKNVNNQKNKLTFS